MKNPLGYQITEFDCGTTSLLNVLNYLFERHEIPTEIVKAIYCHTLDCCDENGNLGQGGTSKSAIKKLTNWINYYANCKTFKIACEYLEGFHVTLKKINECLNENGCALVRCWQTTEHYVIVTKIDKTKVYIFDPYYLPTNAFLKDKDVKMALNNSFTHNRTVSLKRFFSETTKDFSLGIAAQRECVLFKKTK